MGEETQKRARHTKDRTQKGRQTNKNGGPGKKIKTRPPLWTGDRQTQYRGGKLHWDHTHTGEGNTNRAARE